MNSPIKMEVGIEDCLHIEFEYNKSKYHLKDVIVGKIYFLLVRIKIKHMEIAIIKRETTGSGPNIFNENETIAKYEIMDGAPVRGESIPIRVFLAGYDLTPTMRDVNKKFSVKYFLNLVLMDTEDRRYFKQQEITLWRKSEKSRKSISSNTTGAVAGGAGSAVGGSSNNIIGQQSYSSYNPHIPTHLMGQDTSSSLVNKQLAANAAAEAEAAGIGISSGSAIDDEDTSTNSRQTNDPTIGLFTQESPQQEDIKGNNRMMASTHHQNQQSSKNNSFILGDENDRDNDDVDDDNDDGLQVIESRESKNKPANKLTTNTLIESQPPPLPDDQYAQDDDILESNEPFIPAPEPQRRTLTTAERESGDGAAANSQLSFDETSSLFDNLSSDGNAIDEPQPTDSSTETGTSNKVLSKPEN
jgi:hypothetical protein